MAYACEVPTYKSPVSGLRLGAGQLVAPSEFGETRTPSTLGSFSGSRMGCPLASIPLNQFADSMNGFERMFLPLVRSSTKKKPLRLACASSLRGCPLTTPSNKMGTWVASQSCVSCGEHWKYQAIFPVSGSRATMEAVQRLSPGRLCPAMTGFGLPVGT